MQEKIFIRNRKNQKIAVLIDQPKKQIGLAFVMHGLSGSKDQPHIKTMASVLKDNNYIVISFDATNSCGESDGELENTTTTQNLQDLEDVINWSKTKNLYKEPFVLAGHSLGAFCSLLYAEKFPEKIKALAPLATVVSGKLNISRYPKEQIDNWKKEGFREWKGYNGKTKRLKWKYIEDGKKYDVLPKIASLKSPVLLIVGSEDASTPVRDQELLYSKLRCKKEIHIIQGSEHTFRTDKELAELKRLFDNWIKSL